MIFCRKKKKAKYEGTTQKLTKWKKMRGEKT